MLGLSFMGGGFAEECVLDSRVRRMAIYSKTTVV